MVGHLAVSVYSDTNTGVGLMMNSEIWVCLTEKERCLPFVLVDAGYDVWVIHPAMNH